MDLSTIVGLVGGVILVIVSMVLAASVGIFMDFTSIVIVIGGASFATLIRWPINNYIVGLKAIVKTILSTPADRKELIDVIIQLAQTARKESILALEKVTVEEPFLAKGVRYLVDGYPPESINDMLELEIEAKTARHNDGRGLTEHMAEACPAWGMIGTVIGLIVIMANLSDPNAIGPGIAVALITTLYGAITANLVFAPLASKLKFRSAEETGTMNMILEGVNSIAKGENPKVIRQKLEAYIPPKEREGDE